MLLLNMEPMLTLAKRLEQSVNPAIDEYWNKRVTKGSVVPKEIENDPVALAAFPEARRQFAQTVGDAAGNVFGPLGVKIQGKVHVVGTGVGEDFSKIVIAANDRGMPVWGFDVSSECCRGARSVVREISHNIRARYPRDNKVFHADIEAACQPDVMDKDSKFLCLVRVLETLTRPSHDPWKMERVDVQIGRMLTYLKVFWVGAEKRHNDNVDFNNTEPTNFETHEVFMSMGLQEMVGTQAKAKATVLATIPHFKHTYTIALFEGVF